MSEEAVEKKVGYKMKSGHFRVYQLSSLRHLKMKGVSSPPLSPPDSNFRNIER